MHVCLVARAQSVRSLTESYSEKKQSSEEKNLGRKQKLPGQILLFCPYVPSSIVSIYVFAKVPGPFMVARILCLFCASVA